MSAIKKVAIFCGSKKGLNIKYEEHAIELANIIARHKIELVYGGGKKGLMGIVADTVIKQNGIVRGVIPKVLTEWEHQHDKLTELVVVDDMHLRKRKMYELCDAVIILPGGFGTLDELFEVLTWNQLSIHDKKVFILNTDNFYDHLLKHINHLSSEGFLWEGLNDQMSILNSPKEFELQIS